jgi:hypothetical protein
MSAFENPIGLSRPLWRDYSKYDLEVDFLVARLMGVDGFANRSTIGWSGVDPSFPINYQKGGDQGLYRTSYHVLHPDLSITRQMDHWFKHHPTIDCIPRVLDAELQNGLNDAQVGEAIWRSCEIVKDHDGVYPWLYGRYLQFNKWLKYWTQDMVESIFYWGARYLWDRTREHPGPPYYAPSMTNVTIPESHWILHQTADKKPAFSNETEREYVVDWDRWEIGNVPQMHEWITAMYGGTTSGSSADLDVRVTQLEDEMYEVQNWIELHETNHNGGNGNGNGEPVAETIRVKAREQFALHVPVGHDASCGDLDPPGKPVMEPPAQGRVVIYKDQEFSVLAKAKYSCQDDPDSPVIKATGGTPYYEVSAGQPGAGQYARKDKTNRL